MNPISCLFGSWFACAQTAIFSAEPCSENAGETSVVLWITAYESRIPTSRNPNQNRAALWLIFSSSKSAPANRKTGFYENRICAGILEQSTVGAQSIARLCQNLVNSEEYLSPQKTQKAAVFFIQKILGGRMS